MHYGVKGMRWGTRRANRQARSKQKMLERGSAAKIYRKRRSLTQTEMKTALSRLKMEQEFKNLRDKDRKVASKRVMTALEVTSHADAALRFAKAGSRMYKMHKNRFKPVII